MYVRELSSVVFILTLSTFQFRLYIDSFCIFRLYVRKLGVPYQQWGIPSAKFLFDTLIKSSLLLLLKKDRRGRGFTGMACKIFDGSKLVPGKNSLKENVKIC